ncbi:MAG: 2-succinyl-5-enolpyruvyl-6-hydroxy-3-cyclohexene-1-carboxylic-acid synthase [Akkermansiaceae bacterium]
MSSRGWIFDIVSACVAAGIREYVVCAGARNIPLVAALSELEESGDSGEIKVWNHFEERAAGFFALGRSMESGEACAIVTTSGTAVAEVLPATIEAHYQKRPLLIISADRPCSFRGSGAPQVIEQVGIFGDYVSGCEDIEWRDDIKLLEGWDKSSPWHMNICVDEVDISAGTASDPKLSKVRLSDSEAEYENIDVRPALAVINDAWRGLVVMLGGLEPDDREEVWHFLRDLGVPVLADCTSGLREVLGKLTMHDGDRILKQQPPAHVLRIGEVPVGRFWRDLENLPDVNVVSMSRTGFSGLSRQSVVIHGDLTRLVRALGEVSHAGDSQDFLKLSKKSGGKVTELLESFPESEPGMVRTLSVMATMGTSLYLGNSLPIREWNDFSQSDVPYELVRANRGANGIDGQIATWLGATADSENAWGVFGDLTALYDLSAPSLLGQVECRGRMLVVINNSGGDIFNRLPAVQSFDERTSEMVLNSHSHGFNEWAAMWGMDYVCVRGIEGFDFEPSDKTTVVEIVPDPAQTEAFWQAWGII